MCIAGCRVSGLVVPARLSFQPILVEIVCCHYAGKLGSPADREKDLGGR